MLRNRSILTGFFILIFFLNVQSQNSRREYINTFKDLAISEMQRSGIPASITLAQACLESSNGNSELTRKSNNHFGIKCQNGWKGPGIKSDDDKKDECFRKYRNAEVSYIDHTNFLMDNFRYAKLFELKHDNYKGWARGLKKYGYATNPNYAQMLITIIEEEELYKYDNAKSSPYRRNSLFVFGRERDRLIRHKETKQEREGTVVQKQPEDWLKYDKIKAADREVFDFNGLQAVEVKPNDTFEEIAASVDKKVWELKHFNDLPYSVNKPQVATFLYVQVKRFKAPRGTSKHTVKAGESLWSISQEYGIRLGALKRKNHIKNGCQVQVGDELYLRSRR